MGAEEVNLAEFDRLRQESDNRAEVNSRLLTVELLAAGGGVSFSADHPELLFGVAIISSFLWMQWLDNAGHCYKIGAYIAIHLAPRLRRENPAALAWEVFLRDIHGGTHAGRALRSGDNSARLSSSGVTVADYAALVFGGTPVVLVSLGFVQTLRHPSVTSWILAAVGSLLALAGWIIAFSSFREFRRLIAIADDAIRTSSESVLRSPEYTGPPEAETPALED